MEIVFHSFAHSCFNFFYWYKRYSCVYIYKIVPAFSLIILSLLFFKVRRLTANLLYLPRIDGKRIVLTFTSIF